MKMTEQNESPNATKDLAQYIIEHIQSDIDRIKEENRGRATFILGMVVDNEFICNSWYELNRDWYSYCKSIWEELDMHAKLLGDPIGETFHETKKAAHAMYRLWGRRDTDSIARVVEYARSINEMPLEHANCYKNLGHEVSS